MNPKVDGQRGRFEPVSFERELQPEIPAPTSGLNPNNTENHFPMHVTQNEAWSGLIDLDEGESLRPLRDTVFIRRDQHVEKIGSLFIPEKAKQKQQHGTVIAAGPGKRDPKTGEVVPLGVKPGDRVMFDGNTAREFTKDRDLVMVVESEIFFVLDFEPGEEGSGG